MTFYKWPRDPGELTGHEYSWKPPADAAGQHQVRFIASDGCGGFAGGRIRVDVSPVIASPAADALEGPAPLTVKFSSTGSRDANRGPLKYHWDFDDGAASENGDPVHVFRGPGPHQVSLTVTSALGRHTRALIVQVRPSWPAALSNRLERRRGLAGGKTLPESKPTWGP